MNGRKQVATLAVVVVMATVWSSAALARKAPHREDPREVQGRALFGKGDYPAALEVYATLFAEKNDPVHLRNIGRCHQKMQQPEKAIDAFREYLRRAHVKPAERSEVEGFIAEMEDLKKQRADASPPPAKARPVAVEPAAVPVAELPAAPPPAPSAATSGRAPGAVLTQESAPPEEASEGSIAGRWWFWTGLAVLVAGGAATAFVLTRPHGGAKPPCGTDIVCQ